MDAALFESLLYEEESTTVDFKEEQYRFAKATEEERSELLKDILGFANAWRRYDAFILIGVQDVRGGRSIVKGIPATAHLDDHSLQQFVNNLTNRPIRFQYRAFGFEGKQLGVIRIERQTRPVYLKHGYGKLKRNEVYVRRGSSTDPTKPAGPDELAQMGREVEPRSAELAIEFADTELDQSIGTRIAHEAEFCEMPSSESIPDFDIPTSIDLGGFRLAIPTDPFNYPNASFYRQLADYEFATRLFRPVRVVVRNTGQAAATAVRMEMSVSAEPGVQVIENSDVPSVPTTRVRLHNQGVWRQMTSTLAHHPGQVSIEKNAQRYRLVIDCGDMQPGRSVYSDIFFLARATTGETSINGQVFAANLPAPKDFTLAIACTVKHTQLSLDELTDLPSGPEED